MPNKTLDLHKVDETSFPYIYEENATVPLKSSEGLVRVNVYRPKGSSENKVPVLVTYGPSVHPPPNQTILLTLLDTARISHTRSSTPRAFQKSIQSTRESTRRGRHRTLVSGPRMAMQ